MEYDIKPLKNKVIIRRWGNHRSYLEKDIKELCYFIDMKLSEIALARFVDSSGNECLSYNRKDLMKLLEQAFEDAKPKIHDIR